MRWRILCIALKNIFNGLFLKLHNCCKKFCSTFLDCSPTADITSCRRDVIWPRKHMLTLKLSNTGRCETQESYKSLWQQSMNYAYAERPLNACYLVRRKWRGVKSRCVLAAAFDSWTQRPLLILNVRHDCSTARPSAGGEQTLFQTPGFISVLLLLYVTTRISE